ncbi:MAG: type II toxin-antitoxin system mRNA interferase toxin, RelE/StbE family [Nanoarchaeota archaeon]|nr:type II toxin-antitoxin system mRNA interferase toxin, RelE/StbE family [Nanoarchaeota archaeon]
MYKIQIANDKTEKRLREYIQQRNEIKNKLDRLKIDPRRELDAHHLHGRLAGKWSCWLGSNIRLVYTINDSNETIIIEAVGTHKAYRN